ncbi:hypothetical protein VNO77_15236 [Canavalia gladiata]|uniref:Uncharacterized protein n=1 Tax=Canavalia gladiata TaxID=3824 RepID=A0AAN9M443_CANGL
MHVKVLFNDGFGSSYFVNFGASGDATSSASTTFVAPFGSCFHLAASSFVSLCAFQSSILLYRSIALLYCKYHEESHVSSDRNEGFAFKTKQALDLVILERCEKLRNTMLSNPGNVYNYRWKLLV